MGTRADFYVGRGAQAEWIGSIAWDGYPDGIDDLVLHANSEAAFRVAVSTFFDKREDVTLPADGWPWPWDDSRTTDYSYAFDGGKVHASCFGHAWFDPTEAEPEREDESKVDFPDMSARQAVTFGSRSGVIVVGG